MRRQGYAENTVVQYQRIVRRWINSHRSPADWLRRVQERSRGTGPASLPTASAKVYEKAIRAWHVFSGEDSAIVTLPRVVRYRRPRTPHVLTRSQETRLRALLATRDRVAEPCRTLLLLLLDTGLRVSEACTLRLVDIQRQEGLVVLDFVGKGGKHRQVALPDRTVTLVAEFVRGWRRTQAGKWLFTSPQGAGRKPITPTTVRRALAQVGASVGAPEVRPHDLRRTVATRLAESGVDQRIAAAVLGHTNERQTAAYQHPGAEAVRRALQSV